MKDWLLEGNILFCHNMVEVHMFDVITLNKPKHKSYVTHQVVVGLTRPSYHPGLNLNALQRRTQQFILHRWSNCVARDSKKLGEPARKGKKVKLSLCLTN
jgi:hypothetical protein